MVPWTLHFLNARGRLTEIEEALRAETRALQARIEEQAPALALDVLFLAADLPMPRALAVSGMAAGPGRIEVTVDLAQDIALPERLGQLRRTLLHEYHHALRWEGPGYGRSLGEALVSEGLAQRFVHEITDEPSDPWEIAVTGHALDALARRAEAEFDDIAYAHGEWFFGAGQMPVWAGYALGLAMVDRHLAAHPGTTALGLADAPAAPFRAALAQLQSEKPNIM